MDRTVLSQISALAVNVWREAIRDRLLHLLIGSGVLVMSSSIVLGQMAVGAQGRVIENMGFWTLGIWGLIAVIYLGSGVVKREIQQKTIYLVLSRPMNRPTFITGKYVGILFVLFSIFLTLAMVWLILLQLYDIRIHSQHFIAVGFIFGEWLLLAAISLFFASFTSPLLHNFFIVGIAFLGHWSNDLRLFAENAKSFFLQKFLMTLYYAVPNLEALNFREAALYDQIVSSALIWQAAGVLLAWTVTALVAANLIFCQRKLV